MTGLYLIPHKLVIRSGYCKLTVLVGFSDVNTNGASMWFVSGIGKSEADVSEGRQGVGGQRADYTSPCEPT